MKLYPPLPNSPTTTLKESVDASATTIEIVNGSKLPAAPNLATIGTTEAAETILYTSKVGNVLGGIVRGFEGEAREWNKGSYVARMLTAYDILSLQHGYRFVKILYFTENDTFEKDIYPWLRAIEVEVQGGGGSGGGVEKTTGSDRAEAGGGGGGGYAKKFITVDELAVTEQIVIGAGAAPAASAKDGKDGGTSSFGQHLSASGGKAGKLGAAGSGAFSYNGGNGGQGSGGDLNIEGGEGGCGRRIDAYASYANHGGESQLAGRAVSTGTNTTGRAGRKYGGGSTGARNGGLDQAARGSVEGADGIVIITLFA